MRRAGLTSQQIQDRDALLSARSQIEFVNQVADAAGDDLLGFHLGRHFDLREIGLFYYLLASSERLIDVFERGARYTAIVNEGVVQTCIDGAEVGIRLRYTGLSRHRDRHQAEFWSATMVRVCKKLTAASLTPAHVRFAHQRARGTEEMTRFYGCDIEFGASADEITFGRKLRNLPVINPDPYLSRLLLAYSDEVLTHRASTRHSLRAPVENAIVPLLPHGKARTEQVAQRLGMSARTLCRQLSAEDLSFSGLLRELRLNLAHRYLKDNSLSISQIAWLLGYRDITAFSHAFKRWTGKTPRETVRRARRLAT